MFKQRLHMVKDSESFSRRKEWNYSTVRGDRRHFDISNHREISSSHKANGPKPMPNDSPLEIRTFIFCCHNIQPELPSPVADFIIHVMDVKKRYAYVGKYRRRPSNSPCTTTTKSCATLLECTSCRTPRAWREFRRFTISISPNIGCKKSPDPPGLFHWILNHFLKWCL
jgi:hypothetical protein